MKNIKQQRWFFPALVETESAEQPFPLQKEEFLALQGALETGKRLPRNAKEFIASIFEVTLEELEDMNTYLEYSVHVVQFGPFWNAFSYIATDSRKFLTETFPQYLQMARNIVSYSSLIEQRYNEMNQLVQQILQTRDNSQRRPPLEQLRLLLQTMYDEVQPFVLHANEVEQQTALLTQKFEESQQRLEERKRDYGWHFATSGSLREQVDEGKALQAQVTTFNTTYERDVTRNSLRARYHWNEPLGVLANSDNTQRASEGQQYMREMMRLMQAYYSSGKAQAAKAMTDLACTKTDRLVNSTMTDVSMALPAVQKMRGLWTSLQHDITALQEQLEESLDEEIWRLIDAEVREAIQRWKNLAQQAERYLDIATIAVEQ